METFNKFLKNNFNEVLPSGGFKPCATYYHPMDYVEYISVDALTVSRRIDGFLTLVLNKTRDEVVGFQLKGFMCFVNEHLKPLKDISDDDFLSLVTVLENLVLSLGAELVDDKKDAYKKAYKLAKSNPNAMRIEMPRVA